MRYIRVDWDELSEALHDTSQDHRYYLDRETGIVHFFSSYLDNDEDQEDEDRISAESRYVPIPLSLRLVPHSELDDFVRSLGRGKDGRALGSALDDQDAFRRFSEVLDTLPGTREKWNRFRQSSIRQRAKQWLVQVGVEPLEDS